MAQRLVRKVCKKCGQPYTPPETELKALHIDAAMAASAKFTKGRVAPIATRPVAAAGSGSLRSSSSTTKPGN
jgi:type II secretory ATPase GspE/PulE/Tfp pilus assembly ATPase PilB-like protein